MREMKVFVLLVFMTCMSQFSNVLAVDSTSQSISDYDKSITMALNRVLKEPDYSHPKLLELIPITIEKKDTLNTVECMVGLSDIERDRGNYEIAFDYLWDALLLAEAIDETVLLSRINRNLGILYDFYDKTDKSLFHYEEALAISRTIVPRDIRATRQVVSNLFSLSAYYQGQEDYVRALAYLDSCHLMYERKLILPYVEADRGNIYIQTGQLELAEKHLTIAYDELMRQEVIYYIVVLKYFGDLNLKRGQADIALDYYLKSYDALHQENAHNEIIPELLEGIASLYLKQGQPEKAYQYLLESKNEADRLFSTTSKRNSSLFEIKNSYKETLDQQEKMIADQEVLLEQRHLVQQRLKLVIGLILLLGIIILTVLHFRAKLKKVQLKQKLDNEKNDAVLRVKKKEVTTYALQMIEKDKAINELLEVIKTDAPKNYSRVKSLYSSSGDKLWEDFNRRFVEVNVNFYKELNKKHPELTFTEQKHCALIKLKFDSKEMAQLLNISLQSVHTSRYRIRKKVGLAKEDSLSDYIGQF